LPGDQTGGVKTPQKKGCILGKKSKIGGGTVKNSIIGHYLRKWVKLGKGFKSIREASQKTNKKKKKKKKKKNNTIMTWGC